MLRPSLVLLAAGLCALATPLPAQVSSILKTGQVVDATTGRALADALVHVEDVGIRALSDAAGLVSLGPLAPGSYRITVERFGYEPVSGDIEVPGIDNFRVLLPRASYDDLSKTGQLIGRVVDAEGRGLSGVEISLGAGAVRTLSNERGAFTLRNIEPGLTDVRFAHIAYATRDVTVIVQPGATVEVAATLSIAAIELAPIEVTVRNAWLERNGYYDRARQGHGRQFDRQTLDDMNATWLSDVLWRVPGIRLSYGRGTRAVSRRSLSIRGPCTLRLYVDGVQWSSGDIDAVNPDWAEAIEVYQGIGTPIHYGGMESCGAILVWTQR